MFVKIIKSYRIIVAICDSELLGKKFEEGKFQLHIKEDFYKGEKFSEEKVVETIKRMVDEDATFNIVGKRAVNAALKAGVISRDLIGEIQGIPFALVLR